MSGIDRFLGKIRPRGAPSKPTYYGALSRLSARVRLLILLAAPPTALACGDGASKGSRSSNPAGETTECGNFEHTLEDTGLRPSWNDLTKEWVCESAADGLDACLEGGAAAWRGG